MVDAMTMSEVSKSEKLNEVLSLKEVVRKRSIANKPKNSSGLTQRTLTAERRVSCTFI